MGARNVIEREFPIFTPQPVVLILIEPNYPISVKPASSKSKRNGVREASDKSFKIFKRERVVTPLPF